MKINLKIFQINFKTVLYRKPLIAEKDLSN